jgi:hypothetical protein
MLRPEIILLTDYRDQFYESRRSRGANLDLAKAGRYFSDLGYDLKVMQFREVDFQNKTYKGCIVLYQSSEDRGLLYKDFIEDVLLGLDLQGARLIPDFYKFRAHHNKVFMEIMRSVIDCKTIKGITAHGYGTYEEFAADIDRHRDALVLKPASGAQSSGVRLKRGLSAQQRYARRLSSSVNLMEYMKNAVNSIIRKGYRQKSLHRHKFIVQEYVPGLEGDYKVLAYGKKFYVLERRNRKNDFRASGSGLFQFPASLPSGLLDYAADVFACFDVPFISLDIAKCGNSFILLEFQFLCFGNYTLERSTCFFTRAGEGHWIRVDEVPDLERELVTSVVRYIESSIASS